MAPNLPEYAIAFHGVGSTFPIYEDLKKHVYDAGKAAGDGSNAGTVLYNRGMYAAMLATEAARKAQELSGAKDINPAQMRDGMEALEITGARLAELGLDNFGPEIKVTCENHGGRGPAAIAQWDAGGKAWSLVTDYMDPDEEVVILVLSNVQTGIGDSFRRDLGAIFFEEEYAEPRFARTPPAGCAIRDGWPW